jgi:hypothetical protein
MDDIEGAKPSTKRRRRSPDSPPMSITRAITACERCRIRKTKCDQKFPACGECTKKGVECVGIDPATKRRIPRSYVAHLEDRVAALELELQKLGRPVHPTLTDGGVGAEIVRSIGLASQKSTPLPSKDTNTEGYLGESAGLTFARMMFKSITKTQDVRSLGEDGIIYNPSLPKQADRSEPARLPPKPAAEMLLVDFFAQANAQMPILHREMFLIRYFIPVYGNLSRNISLASDHTPLCLTLACDTDTFVDSFYYQTYVDKQEVDTTNVPQEALYFLNMVFAIATSVHQQTYPEQISDGHKNAALLHYDAVLASHDKLEALQALLLLALYSIMRPMVPSPWYTLGNCIRLAVELGLHTEERRKWTDNEPSEPNPFLIDMRRRLFWCTYALDRQVCVYLGRPFGFPEESVKVHFPSELDDSLLMADQSLPLIRDTPHPQPSYKSVSLSIFRIRRLQAEVRRVLYDGVEVSPQYDSLNDWQSAMADRLDNWLQACPKTIEQMNCNFNYVFFHLNYYHTKLLLFGPCTPILTIESFKIVAECGSNIIKKYQELYHNQSINYTWAAVLSLFTAGTSYLGALYHSPEVRAATTLEEIEGNSKACIEVLSSLKDRCVGALPSAQAFELLSAGVIKLIRDEPAMGFQNGEDFNHDDPSIGPNTCSGEQQVAQFLQEASESITDGSAYNVDVSEVPNPHDISEMLSFQVSDQYFANDLAFFNWE